MDDVIFVLPYSMYILGKLHVMRRSAATGPTRQTSIDRWTHTVAVFESLYTRGEHTLQHRRLAEPSTQHRPSKDAVDTYSSTRHEYVVFICAIDALASFH